MPRCNLCWKSLEAIMGNGSLRMPKVSPLSRKKIEYITVDLHQQFYPQCLTTPQMVPIAHFFEFRLPRLKSVTTGVSDLPYSVEGLALPREGIPDLALASEVYDQLLEDNPRARFTAAHEAGHGFL